MTVIATENRDVPAAIRDNFATDLNVQVALNSERGIVFEFRAETPSRFGDFIEQWGGEAGETYEAGEALFEAQRWMPGIVIAQVDDDARPDLLYVNQGVDGRGQLNVHYQQAGNRFNEKPDWRHSFDSDGEWRLVNLDGDERVDLLQWVERGGDWDVRLHRNDNGTFDLEKPAQIMRFGGYDLDVEAVELHGEPALAVTHYAVPAMEAIRNAGVQRVTLLYGAGAEPGEWFARRPAMRLEETFSVDNVRGLAEPIILGHDLDADGGPDALYVTERGTLAARRVNDRLQIESGDFWEHVASRSVFEVDVEELNGDSIPDLVLRHSNATTILVSRP